ncbi:MAG: hypothetical protein K6B70_06605 [Clostridia bacterium]|nr:hypothetical protein [Clostridia bacterium]
MTIDEINYNNRMHMISETRTDLDFKWEDDNLMDILMKKFDEIYPYADDPKEFVEDKECLKVINENIKKINRREIEEKLFLNNMEKELTSILEKYKSLKYQNKYNIEFYKSNLSMANRLLIDGEGGIGKSYFLFKFEEQLENSFINHLCIYCKYTKYIDEEIMNEILSKNDEFYLIIDAFNELDLNEQKDMLGIIKKMLKKNNINIIVSYRTKTLDLSMKESLEQILINTYSFTGVEFESSLTKMIETYGIEATKFIDVIETNNALYIKMLYKILEDPKIRQEEIGDLVQITFILEQYIKTICGRDYWEKTKIIGTYMFENGTHSIEESEIQKLLNGDAIDYIEKMKNNNLIDYYIHDNKKVYVFTTQKLSDYIIARTLQTKITGLSDDEIIKLIDEKLSQIYSLSEPFIILIFDRFKKKNMERALNIIFNSKLKEDFELSVLRKIIFSKEQITQIQSMLQISNLKNAFLELGGYHCRPFNCTNYLTDKIIENKNYMNGITVKYCEPTYIMKLKNMLYSIIFYEEANDYIEEAFWYSFWLTSSPNNRIRKLAIKVLFDIVDKFNDYACILQEYYFKVDEHYIRKAIIRVLTSTSIEDVNMTKFLEDVLNDNLQIDAEIIYRIAYFLGKDTKYIELDKYNIYSEIKENDNVDNSVDLTHILMIADIYEKDLLKFERYSQENELSIWNDFIINNKQEIMEWNDELNKKFECVKNEGYCKYSIGGNRFKKYLKNLEVTEIDNKKMFIGFQKVFVDICNEYNYKYSKENESFDVHLNPFSDSILKKILLISQDILLGSLMCNYFTNEISVYNDDKTFGYKVFEPIDLNEEEYRICSPVSVYCEKIDELNNEIIKRLDLYGERDDTWYRNKDISIENIKKLLLPVISEKEDWTLISADIHRFVTDKDNNHLYTETYDYNIGIDSDRSIVRDKNPKELTINNNEFIGNINNYKTHDYKNSVRIRNIEYNSQDFKETYLNLPPTIILSELNLHYNRMYSTWENDAGETIIYCDNNNKYYYHTPIARAIYIKTKYLSEIMNKHQIKYWAYTEKSYLDKGWNEEASMHIELDKNGNILHNIKNNCLTRTITEENEECKNCKYGIYQEMHKPVNYSDLLKHILDEEEF